MELSREMAAIRILGRVADRKEQCEVNPNFNHWCRTHRQKTCDNRKPLHCSVVGELVEAVNNITVYDGPTTVHLVAGKKYCLECGCTTFWGKNLWHWSLVQGSVNVIKRTKEQLIEIAKDPENPNLIAEINNFYK